MTFWSGEACYFQTAVEGYDALNGIYKWTGCYHGRPKFVKHDTGNGVAAAIVNASNTKSKILVLADISWKPNDNEMKNIDFEKYDWNKWKKPNS